MIDSEAGLDSKTRGRSVQQSGVRLRKLLVLAESEGETGNTGKIKPNHNETKQN